MANKYTYGDIGKFASQSVDSSGKYTDYYRQSLNDTQRRYVRAYLAGDFPKDDNAPRRALRGHPDTAKGDKPVSVVKQERKRQEAPALGRQPRPILPVSQRRKVKGPYLQNMYRKSDTEKKTPLGQRVNARSETTLERKIQKLPDSAGVLFHIINVKTGEEIRAVGSGKGSTVNAGDFKQAIQNELASGASYKDALRATLSNLFTFYGVDPVTGIRTSEELDSIPDDVSNFVMYTIY